MIHERVHVRYTQDASVLHERNVQNAHMIGAEGGSYRVYTQDARGKIEEFMFFYTRQCLTRCTLLINDFHHF